ncbi:MAG: hypothetical protein ACFFA4_10810 [Promethearchaeota archaeon]
MIDKIGIVIRNEKDPPISSNEIKSILSSLETDSIDTIVCDNISKAKEIIKEQYEEISFIYLASPIPKIEKFTNKFIEFITNNRNYKHIEFFARMPKKKKDNKYKWFDDFINYIKF